ncbi:hypothetical protein E4T39_07885 [Aureobasidium subglaciale]|nr:hypothetical protein E4T39_07885 [Aureobasidium subglaciale]
MDATTGTQSDLVNLLDEKNTALTKTKAAAAQSAEAVNNIINENIQLKTEVGRLQEEIKELRTKLWDATVEERKMNADRLRDVLKIDKSQLEPFASESPSCQLNMPRPMTVLASS